jgi:hypothetical protein
MFVIYHKESTILYQHPKTYKSSWDTWRGAKVVRSKAKLDPKEWLIAHKDFFHKGIEKTETKVNLVSGKEFTQPVNTPLCCDPSSETYWSM